jgi:LDH2 family malate/lactate/ureidoglycolate dehydrogenase
MIVIDINAFLPMEKFLDEIETLIDYVKTTPPAPGFSEVLVPGEFEARTAQKRRENGIMVDPETWRQILAVLDEFKIAANVPHGREM